MSNKIMLIASLSSVPKLVGLRDGPILRTATCGAGNEAYMELIKS